VWGVQIRNSQWLRQALMFGRLCCRQDGGP
jgi:hypothetical protein